MMHQWAGDRGCVEGFCCESSQLCTTGQEVKQLHWLLCLPMYKVTVKEQFQYSDRLAGKQACGQVDAQTGKHLSQVTRQVRNKSQSTLRLFSKLPARGPGSKNNRII